MRNKRKLNIALLFILILAFIPNATSAQEGDIYISLALGDEYHISVGDNVVFGWGWITTTRGLVQRAVRNANFGWTLRDSDSNTIAEYHSSGLEGWGAFYTVPMLESYNCPGKWASGEENGWAKHWDQDPQITFDEPGIYTLYFLLQFRTRQIDPCDANADGKPDVYYGMSNIITIIVEE